MVDDLLGFSECGNKSISLNTFMNTHIEMKKLQFHTPDARGKSKCHKIHVGKPREMCPELRVHGTRMESVKSDTYLGDDISFDGSNTLNVKQRVSKGNGLIAKIKDMLESLSLGKHYFRIALLLRESMLINGIITSAESWYGLRKSEIDQLEDLDHQFLMHIFVVPRSLPICALFLETGSISLETIIKMRRVCFLHYLVNLSNEEMLYQVFIAQWERPSRINEWTTEVKANMVDFNISDDFDFLKSQSQDAFLTLVKKNG